MKVPYLHAVSARWFSFLGTTIGRNPHYFIIIPFLISLSLCHSVFRIKIERDVNELFTAVNGRAVEALNSVRRLFVKEELFTTIVRQVSMTDIAWIQAIVRDEGSIFRRSVFEEFSALDNAIRNFNITWDGNIVSYPAICGRAHGECLKSKVLELQSCIENDRLRKKCIKYPIDMSNLTMSFKEYVFSLGGVETDENGYVQEARSVRFLYVFDTGNSSKRAPIAHWLRGVNRMLKEVRFQSIKYVFFNYEKTEEELTAMSSSLLVSVPVVISAVAVFAFVSLMTDNLVRSKPLVGLSSCLSAILATAAGFGLCLACGVPCTDYHLILAFGVLAIEVDDAFILVAAWRKTNPRDSVPNRIRQTYSATGVSITITSMTNIISFLIGIIAPFPVVRYLCIYSAVTVLFSYVYQITFFGGCLALDGYREERRKHPIMFCGEGLEQPPHLCQNEEIEEEFFMRKFRTIVGCSLIHPLTKLVVILLFIANLAVGLWGLNSLLYGSDYSDVLNDNSEMKQLARMHYRYFNHYSFPIHVIIDYPLNYTDPKIQMTIEELMDKLESHPHIADASLRISWLKYYKLFAKSIAAKFLLRGYNMSNKADFLEGLRNVFLNIHNAKQFQEDIVFNEDYTDIVATRFLIPTKDITDPSIELEVMNYAYSVADESPIPVKMFGPNFSVIEQAKLIKGATFMTAAVTGCLILLVFYIFVPNLSCSLCVSSVVICMFFETVGYMSFWNVKLDICSLITLVVCIGFSINYPMHMSFCYVNAHNMRPEGRVKRALFEVGMPIVQGSLSTIFGVLVLAFGSYYVTRAAFKIIYIMTFQTAFHSLFFIPVLLSVFGKCDRSLSVQEDKLDLEAQMNMLEGESKTNRDRKPTTES